MYGEDIYLIVTELIHQYHLKYPEAIFMVFKGKGVFSHSKALNLGMQGLRKDELAFHCDVDMEITDPSFLDRCRRNAIKGKGVYFPEVFKYYNFDIVFQHRKRPQGMPPIASSTGHWGDYGYGMVCIYKIDFIAVGRMNSKIEG